MQNYPLYAWTKDAIGDPAEEAKYTGSFTLYVGGAEVYDRDEADALEAALKPLVGGPLVAKMFRYDTDPAHDPQHPPRRRVAISGCGRVAEIQRAMAVRSASRPRNR